MKLLITIIRIAIGWHFLYEGCIKFFAEKWSAESYLNNSQSFLAGFYHWLAATPERLAVVDFCNIWGLIAIGLALFLGLFVRWAAWGGALLLTAYFFAYPPFGSALLTGDSSVYLVNQLGIEALVLYLLAFLKEQGYGLMFLSDRLIARLRKAKTAVSSPATEPAPSSNEAAAQPQAASSTGMNRRAMLKDLAVVPVLGVTGWSATKHSNFSSVDALSGATIQVGQMDIKELKGELPKGKIGPHELSRIIFGGNLFDGTAHARDLLYVSKLFKSYNTEKKVFESLMLAEQAGINSIAVSDWVVHSGILNRYKKLTGSKMKIINYYIFEEDRKKNEEGVKKAIDLGVDLIQVHGTIGDRMCLNHRIDVVGELVDIIRSQGVTTGIAAHTIDALIQCEEQGIIPDYYMKTMHHDRYWSAHPRENRVAFEMSQPNETRKKADHNMWHDNLFDTFPDRTIEFVNKTKVPVIGFKVLAGGAIEPQDGFRYAFENGADFICVGMFDFQVVEDVNICIDILNNLPNRKRPWYS